MRYMRSTARTSSSSSAIRRRVNGKQKLRGFRASYPAKLDFSIRRIVGERAFWVTEYVIRYDGNPVNTVGIMEFADDTGRSRDVVFRRPVRSAEWRAQWVETEGDSDMRPA